MMPSMNVPTFRRNLLPYYSVYKNKSGKKTRVQIERNKQELRAGQWDIVACKWTGVNI
jgi:hypothetical protein